MPIKISFAIIVASVIGLLVSNYYLHPVYRQVCVDGVTYVGTEYYVAPQIDIKGNLIPCKM